MPDSNLADQETASTDSLTGGHLKDRKNLFLIIFLMLCVLTALSFWVANSYLMQNPSTGWTVMMAISSAKAMLVILFFMHLWWEKSWKYVITVPAMIIGVVLVLLLIPDVGNRFSTYSKTRRTAAPEPYFSSTLPSPEARSLKMSEIP